MPISDSELAALLREVKTVAVLGANDRPGRPVDRVGRYLLAAGYTVIPVHPARAGVWGLTTYRSLAEIPVPVDLVDLFRAAEHCPAHAAEVLKLPARPRCFWMQEGIASPQARALLDDSMLVVEDRCLMVEHARLRGNAHG
ncbi:CoA-binding protein [Desulfovibrio aminophilus]|nr:CoA-binding protein [Desulfovibrio aminophilus]MCM0756250.1 CoA-binding protein [Desulfovibrio aminophilus]